MMKEWDVVQKSDAWLALRREYPLTASEAETIRVGGKGLETLVFKKLSEKYSSGEALRFSNKDTDRGEDSEPTARALYSLERGVEVREVGFITNDEISPVAGCSLDGIIVGEEGLWEGKGFADDKHFKMTIRGVEVEKDYLAQVNMQMLLTGYTWCDFSVYCPNHIPSLLTIRVYADAKIQEEIMAGLKKGEEIIREIEEKHKEILAKLK